MAPMKKEAASATTIVMQMLVCVCGIYAAHVSWALVHERIATHVHVVDGRQQRYDFHLMTGVVSSACGTFVSVMAIMVLALLRRPIEFAPVPLLPLTLSALIAMICGPVNMVAARALPYPVYLTVKMSKMAPTVAVGALVYRARYTAIKLAAATFITIGVVAFFLLGHDAEGHDSHRVADRSSMYVGLVLCAFSLFADGYSTSTQDAVIARSPRLHPIQLMFTMGVATMVCFAAALAVAELLPVQVQSHWYKPELSGSIHFFREAPQALADVVALGALSALGKIFIFAGQSMFGSLTIIAVTTTRKLGSVMLSVFVNGHSITSSQWGAFVAVCIGVGLEARESFSSRRRRLEEAASMERRKQE